LGKRLLKLVGSVVKPIQAGWEGIPRLWAFLIGKKNVALYQQDFKDLDLKDLLCAVNKGLPINKGRHLAGYVPEPGTVRVNGMLVWIQGGVKG
jgi:hypothetical protein